MTEEKRRELVDKVLRGDSNAFETLYNDTKRDVYYTALRILKNEEDAKDVMQETFITAIEKLGSLSDGTKFPQWVKGIAAKKCTRYFRKSKEDSLDEKNELGFEPADENTLIPEEYVSDEVKRQVVMNIINDVLSDVQRQTIIMYYYDEMSLEEIAETMECPIKTVSSRLCSAREKIREAVLIYEKEQGDRLHAIVPVPILTRILHKNAESINVPDISFDVFVKRISEASTNTSATTPTTSINAGGSIKMSKVFTGKAIAGITAGVIAVGGITAAALLNYKNSTAESDTTSTAEVVPKTYVTTTIPKDTVSAPVTEVTELTETTPTETTTIPSAPEDEHEGMEVSKINSASHNDILLWYDPDVWYYSNGETDYLYLKLKDIENCSVNVTSHDYTITKTGDGEYNHMSFDDLIKYEAKEFARVDYFEVSSIEETEIAGFPSYKVISTKDEAIYREEYYINVGEPSVVKVQFEQSFVTDDALDELHKFIESMELCTD